MRLFRVDTVARAYESAVRHILANGYERITENDELTLETDEITLEVKQPLVEDRISSLSPMNRSFMDEYSRQVLEGCESKFDYDYHTRLFKWGEGLVVPLEQVVQGQPWQVRPVKVDQIQYIVQSLVERPETRRAIANTWNPEIDQQSGRDVPCLQTVHCIIRQGKLDMSVVFRSNDMLMAAGANMYMLTKLQNHILAVVNTCQDLQGEQTYTLGRYVHISLVPHVYVKRDASNLERWLHV